MLFMRLLMMSVLSLLVFFFQAEDGIRDFHVTSSDVCSSDLAGFHSGRGRMTRTDNVWIVDDDRSIRWVLEKALQQDGMQPLCFDSADSALPRLQRHQRPDVLISDSRMPGTSGLELLSHLRERYPKLPAILL